MPVPASQMWTVASYVLRQKLKGRKRYPLVLMLEPLYRCNLACAGCGKIQYPGHVLRRQLTPEECFRAVEECGVPTVAIPGGEPLLHPQIDEIVRGLVARKKYVYLCTNALLLKQKMHLFEPSKYLTFSVHMDGEKEHHDLSVCMEGGYEIALDAIRAAVTAGFRVTTNTTVFEGVDSQSVRAFFTEMMDAGVEGMMLSPGYSYDKAPDQQHFTGRERNQAMFRKILSNRDARWQFNMSPLFLEFLMGKRNLQCTAWGMPAYGIFGWQKPCYLLQDGYADTFRELLDSTDWEKYGYESGNAKCANCMLHSGYEEASVLSPPICLIARSTFWPSWRPPMTTSSEMEVALRSSRTRTTVPSRIRRTIGSSASEREFHASQSPFTLRHTRLTVSLPTSPPNTLRSARRTRRVLVPARYAPAISASAASVRRCC